MEQQQLLEVVNDLTNDNICDLINMVAPRLDVYFGLLNMRCLSSGISFASMNGTIIQVNCESADLEDLADDDFISGAIEKTVQKESGRALILADSAHTLAEKINTARLDGKEISDKQTVKLCKVLSVLRDLLAEAA